MSKLCTVAPRATRTHHRSVSRLSIGFAALLAVPTLGPRPARADTGLAVTVVDATTGAPLADVALVAANDETGSTLTARTSALGKARFGGLGTAGRWTVRAEAPPGYSAAVSEPLALRSLYETSVTLALLPLAEAPRARTATTADGVEEVVVLGSSFARLNTTNAEVSATLTEEQLATLPVEARSLERALIRLPNVTQSTGFFPEAPVVAINGSNGLFTNYMIDGLDNNENFLGGQRFTTPLGMAQAVTVLVSNYSVEYGRTANGVVNVTSRAGTNVPEANAFFLIRPGALASDGEFDITDLSGNPIRDDFTRVQVGGWAGGALVRDRTFVFANVEYGRDATFNELRSASLGVDDRIDGTNESLLATVRLDHHFSSAWTATLRANHGRVLVERPGGGLAGGLTFPSAGSVQERLGTNVALTTTFREADWEYHGALQYSRFDWDYGNPLNGPGPQVTLRNPSGETIAVIGHPGFVFDSEENTVQTKHKLVWEGDRQRITFGGDVIVASFSLLGGGNVNGNYVATLTDAQLADLARGQRGSRLLPSDVPADARLDQATFETRPTAFGATQEMYGFFVEDRVEVSSDVSVHLGLRWDYDSLSKGAAPSGDFDNFSPRGGFNWSVLDNVVVRGGAGVFHEKIPYAIYSDALQQSSTSPGFVAQLERLRALGILPGDASIARMTFDGNLGVDATSACTGLFQCPDPSTFAGRRDELQSAERRILNPEGYDNPYSVQSTLGVQWQPAPRVLLSLDGLYTEGFNLVRLRDLNAPAPFTFAGQARTAEEANQTRPALDGGQIPAGGARSIIVSETGGRSRYLALDLGLTRAAGTAWWDRWDASLYYTLSRLENDTDDINFRASDANDFDADWGRSLNDRTHVVSMLLNIYPVEGLTLSLAGLLQSGQPVNFVPDARQFGTTDLNGDGLSFADQFTGNPDRFPGTDRNSGELDWGATFDVGLQFRDRFLLARADVFNVFDAANQSGYPVNFGVSNQRQLGGGAPFVQRSASPPRTFQLQLQVFF